MGLENNEPMSYRSIGQGHFDEMMEQTFLKAHRLAFENNTKVEVVSKITIFPPDVRFPNSGQHQFEVQLKEPKYVSQRFTAALQCGIPLQDGDNIDDANQYNLFSRDVSNGTKDSD